MSIALYGTDEPPTTWRTIHAGRLSFELEHGAIRYVRIDGVEVLRGIAFLVRDAAWGTVAETLHELSVEQDGATANISWRAIATLPAGAITWHAVVMADPNGLVFHVDAAVDAPLTVNRVGFVVLHPLEGMAGRTINVDHIDGARETVSIPLTIAPDQPVFNIAALSHAPAPGLTVRVAFFGDVFEMEDQRNWTDASFKTYVRPLAWPRPFTLAAGVSIVQSVRLTVTGSATPEPPTEVAIQIGVVDGVMPNIALAIGPVDLVDLQASAALAPNQIWLQLDGADPNLPATLSAARSLTTPLTLDLVIDGRDPARELEAVARAALDPAAVVVSLRRDLKTRPSNTLPDGEASAEQVARAARAAFPRARIGGGVRANFAELNRNRPHLAAVDIVAHATSAIVHAADDRSVMETLEALTHVVASVRAMAPNAVYHLGPCTIGMADNPYADAPAANPDHTRLPMARLDPRHFALFSAAWAVGVLSVAARGGVAALSLGYASGELGLLAEDMTPLGHIARLAATAAGRQRLRTASMAGLASVAWTGRGGHELLVANTRAAVHDVRVPWTGSARLIVQDQGTWVWRRIDPLTLTLEPYAVAHLTA